MARSTRLAIALASALTITAAGASAQEETSQPADPYDIRSGADPSEYEVTFKDDPLAALGSDVIVPLIRIRPGVRYPMLHRPRTQFVREMLKSVDKL